MRIRIPTLGLVVALAATACGGTAAPSSAPAASKPASAAPVASASAAAKPSAAASASAKPAASASAKPAAAQTFNIQVDAKNQGGFNLATLAYFPNALQAHPGDTLQFKLFDSGEPHTVTFGTLVEAGLSAAEKLGPPNPFNPPPPPPEMQKLPDLIPPPPILPAAGTAAAKPAASAAAKPAGSAAAKPAGPPVIDAPQVAAQPCFLATGDLPADGKACTADQQKQPDFDGTQSYYNSGWLPTDGTFTVKLAGSIKPGAYRYFCMLHRDAMVGTVTVVDASAPVQTPEQATTEGKDQLDAIVKGLQPAVDGASKATPDKATAGLIVPTVQTAFAATFNPAEVSVPVGGSVTWTIFGPHSISFNLPEDARTFRTVAADKSVHVNQKALAPADSPDIPLPSVPAFAAAPKPEAKPAASGAAAGAPAASGAAAAAAPPPLPPPLVVDSGRFDGKGFRNSGVILSFPITPTIYAYKVTFTQAGTYKYACVIHPDMTGTVKVG